MISKKQALAIAKRLITAEALGVGVDSALLLNEISFRPPEVYGVDLANCWIVYVRQPLLAGLRSSIIVAIDCVTGSVVYRGTANDEG